MFCGTEVAAYGYDYLDQVVSQRGYDGATTLTTYDPLGNVRSVTDPLGNTTRYTYDGLGHQRTQTDPLGNVFRTRVNALGLLVAKETPLPDGGTATERYWYDGAGNLIRVQDAEGGQIRYSYDTRNNLTDVVQPVTLTENFTTAYTYDRESRLLTNRTDGAGRSYAYDALGNVICETDALGQSISYAYDPMGNLISTTDRNGVETTRTYDALSRETAHFNSRDGQAAGTVNTYSMSGLLLESANGEAAHRYTYDSFGRVTEEIASGIRKVYTYDSGDRVTSMKVYQGSVLEMDLAYEYDAAGRLTAVVSGGIRTTYRYDAAGRLIFEENGLTGVQTSYFYTPAGQIAALVAVSGGEMLKWYAYEYDRNGNQTLKVENGQETRYYYDAIGRLEMAELPDGTTQHYTYDARGNRASMAEIWGSTVQVTTYGYDPNNRLLFSENPRESYRYEYDPQGNQTKRIRQSTTFNGTVSDETEFYWNGAGMLAYSIDPNGIISDYAYGPDGLRTRKTVGSEETRYFYENGNLLLELNGDSRITGKTVRGHRLISRETLLDTYGFIQDGHGDVTGLVSPAGELVLDYAYDPFGNETTAQTDYAATWDNPFRYCGEYWDGETQTYYLCARQYDPAAGRFLSEDTHWNPDNLLGESVNAEQFVPDRFAIVQSNNLYVYVASNPIIYKDPNGEIIVSAIVMGAAIGGALNAGINFYEQLTSGVTFKELNWKSIGISFAAGAISGGVAGSAIGLWGQIGVNAFVSGAESALQDIAHGRNIDWDLVGVKAGIGGLAGFAGGKGAQIPEKTVYGKLVSGGAEFSVVYLSYSNRVTAKAAAKSLTIGLAKGTTTQIIVNESVVEIIYKE